MKKSLKANPYFKAAILILCAVILLVFMNTTPPEGLEEVGWHLLGILIVMLLLFISEVVPMIVVCFVLFVLMVVCKVDSIGNLCKSAATSTLFFVLAGFGIGGALMNTNVSTIIFRGLWRMAKGDSKKLISMVVFFAAIVSVFIADSAAQVVTIAVITAVIAALGNPEPGTSKLAGGLMLAVYVGAMTGGLALPSSNPVNITSMGLAETVSGVSMTYFQWCLFGVPVAILFTLFAAWVLPKYFKPEQLTDTQIANINQSFKNLPEKLQFKDIYFLVILFGMLICWILSNWVKSLNTTVVALVGMLLYMLPFEKVQLLTAKEYTKNFTSSVVVVMLCLFPLATCMKSSGLGEWLVNIVFGGATNWSTLAVFVAAGLISFIIHFLIPSGSASASLVTTILGPIMISAGIPIGAAIFCITVQTSVMFLLPIEGACQHTFGRGYYTFNDFLKGTLPLAIFSLAVSCLLTPLLASIFSGLL